MTDQKGILVISLDLELYWGVRDKRSIESYKENLLGVRSVVPLLLKLFKEYEIHATWATVGFLFFDTKDELMKGLPLQKPNYVNKKLSPYAQVNKIGVNEQEDPFHYGLSLIKMISCYRYQEIGSQTFSHYYCLEEGQTVEDFKEDLESAIRIAQKYNLNLESLVFPRNQVNSNYIDVCNELGIKAYRGTELSWIYSAKNQTNEFLLRRGLRLIDAYINISGHNCYSLEQILGSYPFNMPSSRFLRPYNTRWRYLEPLRLQRILSDMTYAAKKGLVYHLWWHPHNFGINIEENFAFVKKILEHYIKLREISKMESLTMEELSHRLINQLNKAQIKLLSNH